MATPRYLLLLMFLPCLLRPVATTQSQQKMDEAQLLLQIKSVWGDPSVLAAWNASAGGAHCRWPYVRCDEAGRISELHLASINVSGPFPNVVCDLSGLTYLDVFNNSITDTFPPSLYLCGSLQYLDLSYNHFYGVLPTDISHGLPSNLTMLHLSGNKFNGSIPAELGEVTSLQMLDLSVNPFNADRLPPSFSKLTNLIRLTASQCSLVGDFPSFVLEMRELEVLLLDNNSLTGSIPPWIWRLEKLKFLDLDMNNFTDNLVVDGFAAMSLEHINLSKNKLVGTIPKVFGHLENLTELYLFGNKFSQALPPELGKHSLGLIYVQVDDNELTGVIPEGLCDGGHLYCFKASRNQLSGSIPTGLANCASLQQLKLDSNQLSGGIP